MDRKKHCQVLVDFRDHGVRFGQYVGVRWVASKVLVAAIALVMVFWDEQVVRCAGFLLLGYLVGALAVTCRTWIITAGIWQVQKEFIDWEKVEAEAATGGKES